MAESGHPTKGVPNELDQFDLLNPTRDEPQLSALPATNLSSTTQAFNNRIQQRKREQDKVLSEAEKLAKQRHNFMIQALVSIRKSLRDVTRIDLGDRFHFALIADDWQGWPRLTAKLSDKLLPETEYPFLRVTAHDRQSRGVIEFEYDPAQPIDSVSLISEIELKRMPSTLKKCVRAYLDVIGDIVLEAERRTEEIEQENELKNRELENLTEKRPKAEGPELSADLFQDEYENNDFLEALPTLDSVESLPSASDSSNKK